MPAELPRDWSLAQRRLHGLTAACVVAAFAVAWPMAGVPLAQLLLKFLLYQLHKTLGIAAFLATLARLVLRARRGRPAASALLPPWQRRAARVVHAALYVLLVAVPVLGYFTAATAPAEIPTFFLGFIRVPHVVGPHEGAFTLLRLVHRAAAILLDVLAAGHALAALHNHLRGIAPLATIWRWRTARTRHSA